jgi:hypothetical protein
MSSQGDHEGLLFSVEGNAEEDVEDCDHEQDRSEPGRPRFLRLVDHEGQADAEDDEVEPESRLNDQVESAMYDVIHGDLQKLRGEKRCKN